MKIKKRINTWKLILSLLCMILCGCAFLGYAFIGNKADALTVESTTSVANPLYSFEDNCYDQTALNQLAQVLLGNDSTKNINDLIDYAKNTAQAGGLPITNKQLTLKYGRYRYTTLASSPYRDFIWMPVYLSKSKAGDAVLTLYLASTSTQTSISRQETGTFSGDTTYSTNYNISAPSNSYGTSHMRAVSLGGGGQYTVYSSDHTSSTTKTANLLASNCNKFTNFIKVSDFTGEFYDDILTPSEISWQEKENYVDAVDPNGYVWPNEAYGSIPAGTQYAYYYPNYFDYAAAGKLNYNIWQNDKVWLPSLSEVGSGNMEGNTSNLNGIWQLTNAQRANVQKSWLRTAKTDVNKGSGYSTYTMFCTDIDGTITYSDTNTQNAIRPAIHLNLSKIAGKTTKPVNLPDTITSLYNGTIQDEYTFTETIPADQLTWYDPLIMDVSFYTDEACSKQYAPIDAGTYYMMVQLKNTDRYFLNSSDAKRKKAKFVIEKIVLPVTWEYDDDSIPTKVSFVETDKAFIYERDHANLPQLGMKYNYASDAIMGLPDFPETMGRYYATAYIIEEDTHNYNYTLSSNRSDIRSETFEVKERDVARPYWLAEEEFLSTSSGSSSRPNDSLTVTYKGKQPVQIANVSKYVKIEIDADNKAALDSIEDKGVYDGVHTYMVEDVTRYIFKISLVDDFNCQWDDSIDSKKTTSYNLYLNLNRAEITVLFDLATSWVSGVEKTGSITVRGVREDQSEAFKLIELYYTRNGIDSERFNADTTGKFTIPANLAIGKYYLVAVMTGTTSWTSNYIMTGGATYRGFEILETIGTFKQSNATWTYKLNGRASGNFYEYYEHSTSSNALTLPHDGTYEFALTYNENILRDDYFVRAVYDGDISTDAAGLHCVTVTIKGYDKNVTFTDITLNIYFYIEKQLYDLTDLEWDYDGTPFTYSGSEYKVMLTSASLNKFPGLTAEYLTNGSGINVGPYVTMVSFKISEEYAQLYELPSEFNENSYTGTFSFSCNWSIEPKTIEVEWTDNSSSSIFFIPTLKTDGAYVDYVYQRESGGSWTDCNSVEPAQTVSVKYRVKPVVKSVYSSNYVLDSDSWKEFTVESGKYPVKVYISINNIRSDETAEFEYTGQPFEAKPVEESGSHAVTDYEVKYYSATSSGGKGAQLSSAPVNVGSYYAVVSSVKFGTAYASDDSDLEVFFKVIPADYDTSELRWQYTHGDVIIVASWDKDQEKWVDFSNKEVKFSFEYDGTPHRIELIGVDSVPGLSIADVVENEYINANDYTARIIVESNPNYNSFPLVFPNNISWSITKQKVDFSQVKWGYIDEDGKEYDYDFEKNPFVYTRVADGDGSRPVVFKVGLINLPDGVRNLLTYYTLCTTQYGATEQSGVSSSSMVGTYHTRFTIAGSYAGDANHEGFSSMDMPSTISTFLDWEIAERPLTRPVYDESWPHFDDKTHDLLAMTGMTEKELLYFKIETLFIDFNNKIENDYRGYAPDGEEPVPFALYHAGTYYVNFYELRTIFNPLNQTVNEEEIFWAQIEIVVEKEILVVIWDEFGSVPTARVSGLYVTDMLETIYTNESGGVVTEQYILTTKDIRFYAQPAITAAYSRNLGFRMATGSVEKISFLSTQFSKEGSTPLQKPKMVNATIEYTGNPITFEISQWKSTYANYLYTAGDSLTQTAVGKYNVVLSFLKDAKAYWADWENRNDYVLSFEIIKPKTIAIDYPEFDKKSAVATGGTIEFTITNWIGLKAYLKFTCSEGLTEISSGVLGAAVPGIYEVVFTFLEGSTGSWKNNTSNPQMEFRVELEIKNPDGSISQIIKPTLKSSTAVYTGSAIEFVINNADYYEKYLTVKSGSLTNTNPGTYKVVFAIKPDANVTFRDGSTEVELSYTISAPIDPEAPVKIEKPSFVNDTMQYTGSAITFKIADWESLYSVYLNITSGSLTKTDVGDYSITLSFKEGTKATWSDGTTDPYTIYFHITAIPKDDPNSIEIPSFVKDSYVFTGDPIYFEIANWDQIEQFVKIDKGYGYLSQQINVGPYSVFLQIKDKTLAYWSNGTTDDIELKFYITKATVATTDIGFDEKGNIIVPTDSDGTLNLDEYLEYVYKDKDGNVVDKDKLKNGEEYTVEVKIKDGKEEEFYANVENAEEVLAQLRSSTYTFVYKSGGGIDPLLIITIAIVVILVLLVIATIIVLAVKRSQYVDDDDDGYADYEEDDD